MIFPKLLIAGTSVVGIGATASAILLLRPSSTNQEVEECSNGKDYDQCMRIKIPESEEAKQARIQREKEEAEKSRDKVLMTRGSYDALEKEKCGSRNFADPNWMTCATGFWQETEKTHYIES